MKIYFTTADQIGTVWDSIIPFPDSSHFDTPLMNDGWEAVNRAIRAHNRVSIHAVGEITDLVVYTWRGYTRVMGYAANFEAERKGCQCEHLEHFDNGPGHPYGSKVLYTKPYKTVEGKYWLCPLCANNCIKPYIIKEN